MRVAAITDILSFYLFSVYLKFENIQFYKRFYTVLHSRMLQRILTLVFTSIEMVLVGGTFYGWSNLQNVFIEENFFSTHEGNFTIQLERLNLVSTISTTVGALMSLLFGFLMDNRGFWFARTVILATVAFSYVLFSFSNIFNNYIIFAGGIILLASNLGLCGRPTAR